MSGSDEEEQYDASRRVQQSSGKEVGQPSTSNGGRSSRVLLSQRSSAVKNIRKLAGALGELSQNSAISDIETQLERLEHNWDRFCTAHDGILAVTGPAELCYQEIECNAISPVYETTKQALEKLLEERREETNHSSENVIKNRKSRDLAKSRIMKISKWATESDHRGTQVSEFEDRLLHLDEMWKAYYLAHDSVLAEEADCNDGDIIELDETEDEFFQTKSRIRKLATIARAAENDTLQTSHVSTASTGSRLQDRRNDLRPAPRQVTGPDNWGRVQQFRPEFRLPQVELPRFSGGYAAWTTFRDRFSCLIGSDEAISSVHKLHYLKSCVDGEAEKHIRAYPITGANFELAWGALVDRYDNARIIINTHIHALMEASPAREGNATSLRNLMDTFTENVSILASLNEPVEAWSSVLSYLLTSKFDSETARCWEQSLTANGRPTFKHIQQFVEARCRSLDAADRNHRKSSASHEGKPSQSNKRNPFLEPQSRAFVAAPDDSCLVCSANHRLYTCPRFVEMSVSERKAIVAENRLCFNCLSGAHLAVSCNRGVCRTCQRRHHTLLHAEDSTVSNNANAMVSLQSVPDEVLLATAQVLVTGADGEQHTVRALIDPGAQCNFITENCVQRLQLRKSAASVPISGIGQASAGHSSGLTHVRVRSTIDSAFQTDVRALVMGTIAGFLPASKIDDEVVAKFAHVRLADPLFNIPAKVDMLLGADVYGELGLGGTIPKDAAGPFAQNTVLGWVVLGSCTSHRRAPQKVHALLSVDEHVQLEAQVRTFWELEELADMTPLTEEEKLCDLHYEKNTTRDSSGRYVVRLPFKPSGVSLGQSRLNALRSMFVLENRFRKNTQLKAKYITFMREYEQLGHMERARVPSPHHAFYLPHLPVVTTKMRVVFDASRRSSSGASLNDNLMVGPKLQDELVNIALRFRCRKVALTSDITKMYRQILVSPDDRDFQRILWREDENDPFVEFRLTTVTYGTSSAPYLAVRTLLKLADDEGDVTQRAAQVLRSDFYVDDLMTGCDDVQEAVELRRQLEGLLAAGGFVLRKWATSHPETLTGVAREDREELVQLEVGVAPFVKALGLYWCPQPDEFRFRVALEGDKATHTKRSVLSEVSKLYDPLGLLTPVVVLAKIFLQSLWKEEIGWDDCLRDQLSSFYNAFRQQLPDVQSIIIPRWIGTAARNMHSTELHGFCDASEKAYCAALYIRTVEQNGMVSVRLMSAKSRVAPTKQLTVPRLELCGAQLLSKLVTAVRRACGFGRSNCFLWTDSQLVLWYLRKQPSELKTFVRHRVSSILELTQDAEWRHVSSGENPADVGSRGVMPSNLKAQHLWWNGPSWLAGESEHWPEPWNPTKPADTGACEIRTPVIALNATTQSSENWCERYSDLQKLIRVSAVIVRFVSVCRNRGCLSARESKAAELKAALSECIKMSQRDRYKLELACCKAGQPVPSSSALAALLPIVDENGVLRVGGRLHNAAIPQDQMHQTILPPKNHLTRLIIKNAHVRALHGSVQLTIATLRQQYWVIGMRREVIGAIRGCMVCFRWRERNREQQLMGSLPQQRVSPNRAFLVSGIDYAGPILIKSGTLRSSRTQKAYIAVFVCFSTRAVHLELVGDLTSAAFLAALHRFFSRRGRCVELHSDCGTNFVGASAELRTWHKQVVRQIADSNPARFLADEGIVWKFIPPGSPTFGGIWESAVKSTKHHLRRVLSDHPLTFEGMATVLAQVEACLNSRPLSAMSDDPDDLAALTPGHFLIGEPIIAIPNPDLSAIPANRLSRWQSHQQLVQHFWRRWHTEYMAALQARAKWRKPERDLIIGDLVLMVDERLPPTKWPLGRVVQTFPGDDGHVRVAAVKTSKDTIRRTVRKLCRLPMPEENDDST